jgi:1-aminocyclopropane-1-carboxylate deaminase/D-cysteine desulfhydrase-like pyridoxal-dependent ACC family enzyme
MTGLATGGNKSRMLEFLIGDALEMGSDVIITGANPLSNHVRQTSAASKKLGLHVVLAISGEKPKEINGNLLLTKVLEAEVRFVGGDEDGLGPIMEEIAEDLRGQGKRPYVIHKFCSVPKGCVGYVNAFIELDAQLKQQDIDLDSMVVSSAAGTFSGLYVGTKAIDSDIKLKGIAISERSEGWKDRLSTLINGTASHIGLDYTCGPSDIDVNTDYIGDGYAKPTEGTIEAIKMAARTEGILLDPIYTGKGMSGLIGLIRKGVYKKGEKILFWHTGGVPSLFTPQFRELFL